MVFNLAITDTLSHTFLKLHRVCQHCMVLQMRPDSPCCLLNISRRLKHIDFHGDPVNSSVSAPRKAAVAGNGVSSSKSSHATEIAADSLLNNVAL